MHVRPRYGTGSVGWSCALSMHAKAAKARGHPFRHLTSIAKISPGRTFRCITQKRSASVDSNSVRSSADDGTPPFRIRFTSDDVPFKGNPRMGQGIRLELKDWHTTYGIHMQDELAPYLGSVDRSAAPNSFSKIGGEQEAYDPDLYEDDAMHGIDAMATAEELDALDPSHRILRTGDLVEIPQLEASKDPLVGVFVRRLGTDNALSQFITLNGKWIHTRQTTVQFVVPNFVGSEIVERLIPHLPYRASEEYLAQSTFFDLSVPRHLSAPIISKLVNFTNEAQDIYRQHAVRLDRAHETLAHEHDLKFGTLIQIARKLLGRPTDVPVSNQEQFATRLALIRAGFAFGFDHRHHRITGFVHIRSKAQVKMVDKVRDWIRQFRDEVAMQKPGSDPLLMKFKSRGGKLIQTFAQKAKKVILESRKDREPTELGNIGPSKKKFPFGPDESIIKYDTKSTGTWTDDEQEIIRFMEAWSCVRAFKRQPTIESQPPLLLQATGLYEGYELRERLGFVFLQEIGVMVPWENRARYDENLLIPSAQHSRPLEQLMSRLENGAADPKKMGLITDDILAPIRQDYGDLPVFCIDKAGAVEIDDGISLESVASDEHWVHVHIANPTAFMNKDSPIARMARHMTETIYMPERAYTMLPNWAARRTFSLGLDRPCLTFSAKLDNNGKMLDYKITAGTVRDVHQLDPSEVDKVLQTGGATAQKMRALIVGTPPPPEVPAKSQTKAEHLSSAKKQALIKLHALARARFGVRSAFSGISLAAVDQDIKVWDKSYKAGLGWSGPSRMVVKRAFGDPTIQLMTSDFSTDLDLTGRMDSNMMVRECMLLACEIGSKWCHDRGIPNIYRGSLRGVSGSKETATQYYRRVLEPMMQRRNGVVPFHMLNSYLNRSNPSTLTLEPLPHEQLGMTHFSKVTSPLRRYGDMVTHWQIQAALLEEHRRGISLVGGKGRDLLPFSATSLQQMMLTLRAREDRIKRAKRAGIAFWTQQLFFRAHYFGEMELPATLTAYISQPTPTGRGQVAIIKEYGVSAEMINPNLDYFPEAKLGDEWEVAIDKVDVYAARTIVKALRLIKRADDEVD